MQSVFTGVTTGTAFETEPIPAAPIVPGARYRVLSADETLVMSSTWSTVYSRWGQPTRTTVAAEPVGFDRVALSAGLHVGNPDHAVVGRLDWVDNSESSITTFGACYLWVGVNRGAGAVSKIGDTAFIANPIGAVGPFDVTIEGEAHGSIHAALPIPSDPGLEGAEFLFQFSTSIGGETIVSDVIGAATGPQAPQTTRSSGGRTSLCNERRGGS